MRWVKVFLKRGFQLALLLLLVLVLLWTVARVMYPTAAQRQAIAELEQWPEYPGENAFALLWTLGRAVPVERLGDVVAADALTVSREQDAQWAGGKSSVMPSAEELPSAANGYPNLVPDDQDRSLFCRGREADCLQRVRDDLEVYSALVTRYAALLDRVDRLADYGYIRSGFPADPWAPMLSYDLAYLTQTRNAVRFARGEAHEAIAATCRDLSTWRRLGARSDGLIPRMFAIQIAGRDGGQLLARMLAEFPPEEPLPAPCREALAPPTGPELSLCNAMRGEFAMNAAFATRNDLAWEQAGAIDRLVAGLVTNNQASLGRRAEGFLTLCTAPADDEAFARRLDALRSENQSAWRFECAGDLMSCALDSLAIPAYADYMLRVLDHGARLRALGTLAWMRDRVGEGRTMDELLADRPPELNVPADGMTFGPDGQTLQIQLRWTRRGETWSIPLPPALARSPS